MTDSGSSFFFLSMSVILSSYVILCLSVFAAYDASGLGNWPLYDH